MKIFVYILILCISIVNYVQQTNALHRLKPYASLKSSPKTYDAHRHNYGYQQHQEQQQQLSNGYQSQQQQMSMQYRYYPNHNPYPTHHYIHEQQQSLPHGYQSSQQMTNYKYYVPTETPFVFYNYDTQYPLQYHQEQQQQMLHSGANVNTAQSIESNQDFQQQYQSLHGNGNGYGLERTQLQYQDEGERLQEQDLTMYNVPQHQGDVDGTQSQQFAEYPESSKIYQKQEPYDTSRDSEPSAQYQLPQSAFENSHFVQQPLPMPESMDNNEQTKIDETFSEPSVNITSTESTQDKKSDLMNYIPKLNNENLCQYQSVDGLLPHPYDCSKFLRCEYGRTHEFDCAPGTDFDSLLLMCGHKRQVNCIPNGGSSNGKLLTLSNFGQIPPGKFIPRALRILNKQQFEIRCPLDVVGIFPYPFSNNKYIKCIDGRLLIKLCRQGFMFSLKRKLCDINDEIQSFDTAVPVRLSEKSKYIAKNDIEQEMKVLECPAAVNDIFIFPFLNTRYVKCMNGGTEIETCLKGAVYSIRNQKCMPAGKVDDNDVVPGIGAELDMDTNTNTLGVVCEPQSIGKYPHPKDWRKYVICRDNGVIAVRKCPRNKIFDLSKLSCVEMEDD